MQQRSSFREGRSKVLFEMPEGQPGRANQAAGESLLDERLELGETKQGDSALPTLPDEAFFLRLELGVAGLEEPSRVGHSAVKCHHCDRFTHA